MAKLSGKCAIVSGSTGGLGSVIVDALISEGCDVIGLHSGRTAPHDSESSEMGSVRYVAVDVNDVRDVHDRLSSLHIVPDILCHCVGGILPAKSLEDVTVQEWSKMLDLNVTSAFLLMKELLPGMKQRRSGRIIMISAMSGVNPPPRHGGYPAAKAALNALVRMVAEEVKGAGDITINAIAPGIIATTANKEWGSEEEQRTWTAPEDIAAMVIQLSAEHSASVNGAIIQLNGKR